MALKVSGLYLARAAGQPMESELRLNLYAKGVYGDRYARGDGRWQIRDRNQGRPHRERGVSFILASALREAAIENGWADGLNVGALSRRNVILDGEETDLGQLIDVRFKIGEAELEGVGDCDPCAIPNKLSEDKIPGFHTIPSEAGLRARVITPGIIAIGNEIEVL